MADYRLDIYDTSGAKKFSLTDFTSLGYTKRVNEPGIVNFTVSGEHSLLQTLGDKWRVYVMRRPESTGTWVRETVALARKVTWQYEDKSTALVICNGLMSMLDYRIVAWYTNTNNRSKFVGVPAETIMKTLVNYNAGSLATVLQGRLRAGTITGLSVEADGAHGTSLNWYCAYDKLLKTLQELAKIGGGDFDLVPVTTSTWQFRWYTGQLGTDRTATVLFALTRGNMASPVYDDDRTQEQTVAVVGGKGEEAGRTIEVRTGTNYNVTSNNIEMFVAATDIDTTAGLQARGDQELANTEALVGFKFGVLQVPSCEYDVHYFLGDLVTAINPFNGVSYTVKVNGVIVSVESGGKENISIEMSEPL